MKPNVVLVSVAFLALAGAVAQAEEASPPPAAAPVVVPAPAPVVAPKPSAPPAAPAAAPRPAPAEKVKPVATPPPASPPAATPEPTHSGDLPPPRETKTAAEPGGLAAYAWPVFSFAMLIVGFAAGYFWRHHISRHRLGGMTVRIGTWRGTP